MCKIYDTIAYFVRSQSAPPDEGPGATAFSARDDTFGRRRGIEQAAKAQRRVVPAGLLESDC